MLEEYGEIVHSNTYTHNKLIKENKKMRELNLIANTEEEKMVLEYLQENASDVLAEKINNGVPIEKDGKKFKDIKTVIKYKDGSIRELVTEE